MSSGTLADRICELLGQGLTGTIVASTVGCDPSYITQLMEDEDFKQRVLIKKATRAESAVRKDQLWDDIEEQTLMKAKEMVGFVTRPADLIRLASLANNAKRRAADLSNATENTAPVVQLTLPQGAIIHFQMNAQAQVVEVEGRSMMPLSTKKLGNMIEERRAQRGTEIVEVEIPALEAPAPAKTLPQQLPMERKKVESLLEAIGGELDAVEVPRIL